jgi:polyhydroxyalkanoate synthesis regulator phasin
MDDMIQKAVDVSIGAIVGAKEALDKLAAELAERGRAARGKGSGLAAEVRSKGRAEKESLKRYADAELQRILEKAHIATAQDITRIEERLARIEARLAELEGESGGGAS